MTELQFTLYCLQPLSDEVRENFELPGDPYTDEDTVLYLKSLGVVFYRDERKTSAVIILPDDDNETHILDRVGWLAHKCAGIMDAELLKIKPWPDGMTHEDRRKRIAWVAEHGHDKSWMFWNKVVTVRTMSEVEVVTV